MTKCPACAFDNPDAQKFCGECGTPLHPAAGAERMPLPYTPPHLAQRILTLRSALEGERKLVTVMFCDIANSTPLAARVGAEAMHALLNDFFEAALAEVHRYEGTVNQFLGDGFMALFGAPLAHEDHARRALLAALGLRRRLREMSGQAAPLRDVRVRMGINTGTVVVGKIGDNLRMDYTAVGDTTNLAARLQQHAEPDVIRTSEATRRAAQPHFEFRALGKQALKGMAEPVDVYDLVAARAADDVGVEIEAARVSSPLVGRDHEQAALLASLAALCEGRGGVVLVRGEPGAGKSRLIAEARRLGGFERLLWLEGRALSFGRHLSYWPFIEILRKCFGIEASDPEAQAWSKLEHGAGELFEDRVKEVVPYLATVLSLEMTGDYEQRVKFLDAQALRRQVFLRMRELFERLAQRQPVVLVMEDWHWVDHSSVALCEHLLPLARTNALLFWFAARAEPPAALDSIRGAVTADGGGRLEEVELSALREDDVGALIDNLVGARDLPRRVRSEILRKTGGNPFFVEEVIRALIADGSLTRDPRQGSWRLARPIETLVLPDSVQAVILARIDRLEEGVKSVLKLASVIGRSFFLRILQVIAEAGEAVAPRLVELEHAELIRLRQQAPELEYIFKHALVQEAVYGSILVERRRAIHGHVAEAIETVFADRLDEFPSLLAYHYALAENWEKAQDYLFKAGDHAGRIAADAEALEHYRQAEATYAKVAAREFTPLQRATLDRKLGQAFYGVGDYEQAVEHCSRALAHLGIAYPRTRAGVRLGMAKLLAAHFLRRLVPGNRSAPRRTLDLATAREISTICRSLAWLDYWVDEERFALDSLIELRAGEQSGDVLARVRGLGTLAIALLTFRALATARRRVDEATAIARRGDDPAATALAALSRGWLEFVTGSLDDAFSALNESIAAFDGIGDIRGWAAPCSFTCRIYYLRADFASMGQLASDMLRVGRDAGDPHVVAWARNGLGLRALTVGPLDEAASHLSDVWELTSQISAFRVQAFVGAALGKCRVRQGRLAEAATILEQSVELIETKNLRGEWSSDPLNAFAELWLAKAERTSGSPRDDALRTARRACAKALTCTRAAPTWRTETERLHGTLAWLSGDRGSADAWWRKSLTTAERVGMPIERARTLLERGQRSGDIALVDEATLAFEATGAGVDLACSLHARARLAADAGGDITATLQRYDQAIAALDAMKVEYELGVALRQRARLLGTSLS